MAGSLPAVSYASIVVGFLGFAFTVFTFLRVFWSALQTMWSAPKENRQLLDSLRTELYGERTYFKDAIKQARSRSKNSTREPTEITAFAILNDSIKSMMRDFRDLEAPFLDTDGSSVDPDIEKFGQVKLRPDYGRMDFQLRFLWLHTKDDFMSIQNQVTRIQARRIAYETSNTLTYVLRGSRYQILTV